MKTLDNLIIDGKLSTPLILYKNDTQVIFTAIHILFTSVVEKNVYNH